MDYTPLKDSMSERALRLNEETVTVNIHDHLMFELMIRRDQGERNVFEKHFAPNLRKGGINVIATTVGANSPCVCNLTDLLEYGSFDQIDALYEEEKEGDSFRICRNYDEIMAAAGAGKTAVLMSFEGSRALEGRPDEDNLCMLRIFHRLGLRVNCMVGGGRTHFAGGMGDARSGAGLTTFGVKAVQEMNRIGMLVDVTHMTDPGFFDVIEVTEKPIVVSHIGVKKVCPVETNLSDDQIRAIGRNGGVIGMEMTKIETRLGAADRGETVTFDTVVDHIDHIAELIGPEHVGLGLDFDNFDLIHNIHRAMCPAPGSIEGFPTGIPKGDQMLDEPNKIEECHVIAEYLVRRGYSDRDIQGILGNNMLRLLKETLK